MNYPPYNPYNLQFTGATPQQYGQLPQIYNPPVQQPSGISGRVVQTETDVAPNEVPNDNTVGYYPSADGKVIWAKTWNSYGGISTQEYVLKETPEQPVIDPLEPIIERLSAIETALNDLKPKPRTRKATDE